MKTGNILVFFFLIIPFSIHAQWGIKAGVDYGKLAGHGGTKYRPGYHIGVTYDYKLSGNFYLQPAFLFSYYQFGFKTDSYLKKGAVDKYNLELPINLSLKPQLTENIKLVTDFGMYFKYGLGGNYKFEYWDFPKNTGSAFDDAYNRFDYGINIGVGCEIDKIFIGLSYQYGLTGATSDKDSKTHNQLLRLSLGYKF